MTSLERMTEVTQRLGIYDFSREPEVAAELAAYASAIDQIESAEASALRDLFPSCADEEGLLRFEKLLHLLPEGELVRRREAVYSLLTRRIGRWSRSEYQELLKNSGFTGTWTEDFAHGALILKFEEEASVEQMRDVFAASYRLLPAQLRPATDAEPMTWDQLDAAGLPFSQWDESCICWDAAGIQNKGGAFYGEQQQDAEPWAERLGRIRPAPDGGF